MFRHLASVLVLVLLIPVFAFAQAPYPPYQLGAVSFGADMAVLWQKTTLSHRDQLTLNGSGTVTEFGVTAINPVAWKIRYSLTTSQSGSEEITPDENLTIGSTGFGKKGGGKATAQDIVQIDWSAGPNQRAELVLLGLNTRPTQFWLHPVLATEWLQGSITAEKSDGSKKTRDFEKHNSLFAGIGAECVYDYRSSRVVFLGVGSPNYTLANVSGSWFVTDRIQLGLGWQYRFFKLNNATLRMNGLLFGLNATF